MFMVRVEIMIRVGISEPASRPRPDLQRFIRCEDLEHLCAGEAFFSDSQTRRPCKELARGGKGGGVVVADLEAVDQVERVGGVLRHHAARHSEQFNGLLNGTAILDDCRQKRVGGSRAGGERDLSLQ